MSRGFLNHIWYKLLDEEGVPIPSAAVYIYSLNGNTLTLYNASGGSASNPVYTDSTGAFEFYVKDDIGVPSGSNGYYPWDTEYIISWNNGVESGIIRGDALFGRYGQIDETDSGNTRLNKALSNYMGWVIQDHVDFQFGVTARCGSSSSSSSSTSSTSSSSESNSSSSSSESSTTTVVLSACGSCDGLKLTTDTTPSAATLISAPQLIDGIRHINIGNVFLVNNSYGFDLSTSSGATINGMSVYGNISLGSVSGSVWDNAARDSVKVWASNDNVNWSEVEQFDAPPIIKGLGLGNWGFTLTLSTPQTNYRYYKISNAESDYLTISSNQINPGEIEVF
jgi:hypothetical protein